MLSILRNTALLTFVAGLSLLVFGLVSYFTEAPAAEPEEPPRVFDYVPTATPTARATATVTVTATATVPAVPTPTPFAGPVARLKIPRFDVDAAIESIGVDASNRMEVPADYRNVGWYDPAETGWTAIPSIPGWAGNSVFSAHVDWYPSMRGPFYDLDQVEQGDLIIIVMEDGTEYTYEAVRLTRYTATTMPTGDIIWPTDKPEGEEWVTLITCGGTLVRDYPGGPGHYEQRDVVVARRVTVAPDTGEIP